MGFSEHMKVLLGVDTKGFNNGLSKAETRATAFGKVMKSKVLPFLGAAALARTTQKVVDFGAAIGDMSDRLGVGSEFLQKFQYAASQNGIASNEAGIALQRFTRRVADAKANGGRLAETLTQLGITFNDSSGRAKTSEELFQEFGAALSNMKDPAEKLRVAFTFLDTEGAKLTQLFREGVPTIAEYGKEAERLGIIVGDDQVKALQGASGAMEEMGKTFSSFLAMAAKPMTVAVKSLNEILKFGVSVIKENSTAIGAAAVAVGLYVGSLKALKGALAVTAGIKAMGVAAGLTAVRMKLLAAATQAVFTGNFARGAKAATIAFRGFSAALAANPIGLVTVALAAIAAPLVLFKKQLADATAEGRRLAEVSRQQLKDALAKLQGEINNTSLKIKELNERLRELRNDGKKPVEVNLEAKIQGLEEANEQLRIGEKRMRERLQFLASEEEIFLRIVAKNKENNDESGRALSSERTLKRFQKEKKEIIQKLLQLRVEEKENLNEIAAAQKKIADEEEARRLGITDLLKGKQKETLELERQTELLKAAKTGNAELVEQVRQRHKFEDEVVALHKQGNMSLEEAAKLVQKRHAVDKQLEAAENAIADAIEKQKNNKAGVNDEAKRALEQALQEKRVHEQNQKIFQDQLRILQLRAQGRNDDADLLEKMLENEKQVAEIMEAQGVTEGQAIDLLKQKLALEKNITQEKLNQQIAEITNSNLVAGQELNELGASDRADILRGMTREERQRAMDQLRAARLQAKLDSGKLNPREQAELQERLDALKEKLLTDEQRKEIAALEQKKKEAEKQQKEMLAALEKQKKEAEQELAKKAKAEKEKLEKVLGAGEEAIENVGKGIVAEIKKIKAPKIDTRGIEAAIDRVNARINIAPHVPVSPTYTPDGSSGGGVTTELVAKLDDSDISTETTLKDVAQTLKGKFVNQ